MAIKMIPLTLDGIEEGDFIAEANQELQRVQRQLIAHVRKFGERASGAEAEVTIKITLKELQTAFSIKTKVTGKTPARPVGISTAIEADGVLFMSPSGTHREKPSDQPGQSVLCTENGRAIDPVTGETEV